MNRDEAQRLIQMAKRLMHEGIYYLPEQGKQGKMNLVSVFSKNDRFTVDINRSSKIRYDKYTLQLRFGKDQGLLRIDVGGPNHENPDGTIVPCPHMHIQIQDRGLWDAWAYSLPEVFGDADDKIQTLVEFLEYCNVNNISSISICEQTEMR